jgi:hypothetical protein
MKRKSVESAHTPPPPPQHQVPTWVAEMQDYYRRTGLYRARDLNRVLGDPRTQIVGEPAEGLLVACGIPKK